MKKFLSGIILFCCAFLPLVSSAYKNPGAPTGFVNDFAGMLSKEQKINIENKLSDFEKQTTDEVVVATVADLGGDTIENFAVKLFEDWKVGKAENDNGVLLLISRDDKKIRIEVGYGLELELTDAQSSSIIRNIITPAFKQSDYDAGISNAVDAITKTLSGDTRAILKEDTSGQKNSIFTIFVVGFVFVSWFGSVLSRSKSWWLGGVVGGALGVIAGFLFGFFYWGIAATAVLIPLGLFFDFVVSKAYSNSVSFGTRVPWWGGGFGGGSGGSGGFGGFGGGSSGGGGASGGW